MAYHCAHFNVRFRMMGTITEDLANSRKLLQVVLLKTRWSEINDTRAALEAEDL